jgi:hypothetical protein
VRTAAVAALIAFSVAAVGFGLQAAGLRRTPQANAVAARAATWMLRYRFVTSTLRLGERIVHGQCFHGRIEGRHERPVHGTILVFDDGASVRVIDPNTLLSQGPRRLLPASALELAGCTQVLGNRIAALAQFDNHVRLQRTSIFGRPVFALHFQRLTLLVSTKTNRPLGVTLGGIASTIRLSAITPLASQALEQSE